MAKIFYKSDERELHRKNFKSFSFGFDPHSDYVFLHVYGPDTLSCQSTAVNDLLWNGSRVPGILMNTSDIIISQRIGNANLFIIMLSYLYQDNRYSFRDPYPKPL